MLSDDETTRKSPLYRWKKRYRPPPVIVGIVLVATGGNGGTWQRIDKNYAAFTPPAGYFNDHPAYARIVNETVDGQAMVKVPKYWFRTGLVPSGTYAGKRFWMVSDQPTEGFVPHPAFMSNGAEIEAFWVGKYHATADGETKIGSAPGVYPLAGRPLTTYRSLAAGRNVGGVTGFSVWDVYQWAAILIPALIEVGGGNFQALVGAGNVSSGGILPTDNATVAQATWRGIVGLWGNVYQWLDGISTDSVGKIRIFDRSGYRSIKTTSLSAPANWNYPVTLSTASGDDYNLADVFVPATVDSPISIATFPDIWFQGGSSACLVGGTYNMGDDAGPFGLRINQSEPSALPYIGTRLAKI